MEMLPIIDKDKALEKNIVTGTILRPIKTTDDSRYDEHMSSHAVYKKSINTLKSTIR
jgi:hypothetical protein